LKIGYSIDPEAGMGPLVTRQHLDRVRSYVDLGVEEGAKLIIDESVFSKRLYDYD
jgi:malonate-semialdehyde dehydrogenase (acetylating)/methylmalonate-semialdehyde dehydrogenase